MNMNNKIMSKTNLTREEKVKLVKNTISKYINKAMEELDSYEDITVVYGTLNMLNEQEESVTLGHILVCDNNNIVGETKGLPIRDRLYCTNMDYISTQLDLKADESTLTDPNTL